MHRILLREIVIDVPTEQLAATRDFWAAALTAQPRVVEDATEFVALEHAASLAMVGLQDVGSDAARLHLDIESDAIEAEVSRLKRLGATEQGRHGGWVVMRDPAGLLFCVVRPESPDFEQRARAVN